MRNTNRQKTLLLAAAAALVLPGLITTTGCNEKKEERKMTLEGPDNKYEVEIESTEKNPDKEDD